MVYRWRKYKNKFSLAKFGFTNCRMMTIHKLPYKYNVLSYTTLQENQLKPVPTPELDLD